MNSVFEGYGPWRGAISRRNLGALVATQAGVTTPYALFGIQDRGTLFVEPGTQV